MAVIKSVLETLEGLQEELKQFYTEGEDGKFYLNLTDDVRTHPKTQPLQNAHERTKQTLKETKEALEVAETRLDGIPEDFDSEKLAELQAKADAAGGVKIDEQLAAQRTSLEEKHARALKAKDDEIAAEKKKNENLTGEIRKSTIDLELDSAMDAAKIDSKHRRAVRALIKTDSVLDVTEEGDVVVQSKQGYPVPLKEFVTEQAETDLKPYVSQASGDGGKGNPGSGNAGENPFLAAQWNKTAQARLPADKQEALAKAAGFSNAQMGLAASKAAKAA